MRKFIGVLILSHLFAAAWYGAYFFHHIKYPEWMEFPLFTTTIVFIITSIWMGLYLVLENPKRRN